MSLLTIVQSAFSEIGLATSANSPATVVGNSDLNVVKAFNLANRVCKVLTNSTDAANYWPVLRKQFLFNLIGVGPWTGTFTYNSPVITNVAYTGSMTQNAAWAALQPAWQVSDTYVLNDTMIAAGGVNQSGATITMTENANLTSTQGPYTDTYLAFGQEAYPLPPDLNYWISQTGWDRNFRWQMLGPVTAQEWQVLKSGISPVGPRLRYRLMQGQIYINPAPYVPVGQSSPLSDLIVFEYASQYWCAPAGSTGQPTQASFVMDTDIVLAYPEDLVTLGLKARMLKALGQAYAEEQKEFDDEVAKRTGRETMPRNLPLNSRASGIRLLNSQNVPDTGFGS